MDTYLNYELHAAEELDKYNSSFLISGVGMTPHRIAALFIQNYIDKISKSKMSLKIRTKLEIADFF